MNLKLLSEQLMSTCSDIKVTVLSEGLELAAPVQEDQKLAQQLCGLDKLQGENAKLFGLFLTNFQIDVASRNDYVQWNPGVFRKDTNGIRFYVGASGTSAYAQIDNGFFVAVEEIDSADGHVSHFDFFTDWLKHHYNMHLESFKLEKKFRDNTKWWKFW